VTLSEVARISQARRECEDEPVDRPVEHIEAAWFILFTALRDGNPRRKAKFRGKDISPPAPSYRDGVERLLEAKTVRDAKRVRIGVARR
jgi:hypothetical protein